MRRPTRTLAGAAVAGLVAGFLAAAAPATEEPRFMPNALTPEVVQGILELARANLHLATLSDGSPVPAETPAERQRPLLSEADGARIIDTGFVSAFAKWCGLDWERDSFQRLMAFERARGIHSEKAIAYVAMVHGIAMGTLQKELATAGACPDETRGRVESFLQHRQE